MHIQKVERPALQDGEEGVSGKRNHVEMWTEAHGYQCVGRESRGAGKTGPSREAGRWVRQGGSGLHSRRFFFLELFI